MAEFPAMPLFTDAYLADTGHLSGIESGAYLHLLIVAWRMPDRSLPDDDVRLARWARFDLRTWRRIKPTVMSFWKLERGQWTQKRQLDEWEHVSKVAEVRRKAAELRWDGKTLKSRKSRHAHAVQMECIIDAPTPTPTDKDKTLAHHDERERKKKKGTAEEEFNQFWQAYPRKVGKKAAQRSFARAMKETTLVVILSALAIDAAGWKEERFTPHPTTWLNRGSYLDRVIVEQKPYRPEGWTDADEQRLLERTASESSELLDKGAGIRDDEKTEPVGNGQGWKFAVRRMG